MIKTSNRSRKYLFKRGRIIEINFEGTRNFSVCVSQLTSTNLKK